MKKSSSHLFQVIKSLTNAEKRHFYRYAHQHRVAAPNYFCFYEVLEKMPEWNPERLAETLQETGITQSLPVLKHQLYENVLEALDQLHRRNDPEEKIKQQLHETYLLLKRGLLVAARQRWQKAQKKLEQHELYHLWPALLKTDALLAEREIRQPATGYQPHLESRTNGLKLMQEQLDTHQEKLAAYARHYHNSPTSQSTPPNTSANSQTARADQLQTQALQAFAAGRVTEARQYNKSLLDALVSLSPKLKSVPERYLSTLYNYLLDQLQLKEYALLNEGLQQLRQLPKQAGYRKLRGVRSRVFEWGYQLELNSLLAQARFTAALPKLKGLKIGLEKYTSEISAPGFAALHHLGALAAFHGQEFALALDFLQPLYQNQKPTATKDIYHHAFYLQLLCYFELQQYDLAENLLDNLKRRQRENDAPTQEDLKFQSWFKRLIDQPENKKAIRKEWLSAHEWGGKLERYLYLSVWLTSSA